MKKKILIVGLMVAWVLDIPATTYHMMSHELRMQKSPPLPVNKYPQAPKVRICDGLCGGSCGDVWLVDDRSLVPMMDRSWSRVKVRDVQEKLHIEMVTQRELYKWEMLTNPPIVKVDVVPSLPMLKEIPKPVHHLVSTRTNIGEALLFMERMGYTGITTNATPEQRRFGQSGFDVDGKKSMLPYMKRLPLSISRSDTNYNMKLREWIYTNSILDMPKEPSGGGDLYYPFPTNLVDWYAITIYRRVQTNNNNWPTYDGTNYGWNNQLTPAAAYSVQINHEGDWNYITFPNGTVSIGVELFTNPHFVAGLQYPYLADAECPFSGGEVVFEGSAHSIGFSLTNTLPMVRCSTSWIIACNVFAGGGTAELDVSVIGSSGPPDDVLITRPGPSINLPPPPDRDKGIEILINGGGNAPWRIESTPDLGTSWTTAAEVLTDANGLVSTNVGPVLDSEFFRAYELK